MNTPAPVLIGAPGAIRDPSWSIKVAMTVQTTFSLTLNEPARVSFAFTQQAAGRKVKGKCVAQTHKNRHARACKRTITRGVLSMTGHAGTNKLSFQGRISRSRKLAQGRYTLTITATNTACQQSRPKTLSFTIVR